MTTIFISDLHLDESHPRETDIFFRFLEKEASRVDALYILGDLFEAWVGDDLVSDFHQEVIAKLKKLTQSGVPVYVMPGNRDFLLGPSFLAQTGCQALQDPTIISLYGHSVLLMHGDTLCTEDKAYLRYRAIVRNSLCKKLFLGLPLKWRQRIAGRLREASRRYTSTVDTHIMDVTDSEVLKKMTLYQADFLIHGHTHRPMIRDFTAPHEEIYRRHVVLGDWHQQGHMLICDATMNMRLLFFS